LYAPVPFDLGVADFGAHSYTIEKVSGGNWVGKIDGVTKFNFDGSANGAISCWQAGDKGAQYLVETQDRGDRASCIGLSCAHTDFNGTKYQTEVGGTWFYMHLQDPCWDDGYYSTAANLWMLCNDDNSDDNHFGVWTETADGH
jgi:hypothetical protein